MPMNQQFLGHLSCKLEDLADLMPENTRCMKMHYVSMPRTRQVLQVLQYVAARCGTLQYVAVRSGTSP